MKKICIDIGHAAGTGATGNGLEEHGVAVQIAAHLARYLRERGHNVSVIDYPVKAVLTREVTLFISAAAPGQPGGDMDTANRMTDDVLRVLTWSALGYAGRIICKPRQAAPLPIVWEDAPGRAVWSMTIDVTCLENEF